MNFLCTFIMMLFVHYVFSQSNSWQYLAIVQRWPGTTQTTPLPNFVKTWQLHGLWPTNFDGTYPSDCNNNYPFNANNISSIRSQLETVWYDIKFNTNGTDFWSHEWDKHGTCMLNVLTGELQFFLDAIDFHNRYNLLTFLANKGITPSDTTTYSMASITAAIQSGYGNKPSIDCEYFSGNDHIHRVYLCVDPTFKPIDCPSQSWTL